MREKNRLPGDKRVMENSQASHVEWSWPKAIGPERWQDWTDHRVFVFHTRVPEIVPRVKSLAFLGDLHNYQSEWMPNKWQLTLDQSESMIAINSKLYQWNSFSFRQIQTIHKLEVSELSFPAPSFHFLQFFLSHPSYLFQQSSAFKWSSLLCFSILTQKRLIYQSFTP